MKKEFRIKEPIKVRTKKIASGCESVYLDIYINKKRKYEFLKLYIIPEICAADKKRNQETIKLANAIKSQRIIELQNGVYGFSYLEGKADYQLAEYVKCIADRDMGKTSRTMSMNTLAYHLMCYDKRGATLQQVDKEYILGFVDYLKKAVQKHSKKRKTLSANTQVYYFKLLNYCLNYAFTEGFISVNPMVKIMQEEKPKRKKTERAFLTMDEVRAMAHADFYNKMLKYAFLFSCFCGLRYSDIAALTWGNLRKHANGVVYVDIVQRKTGESISLPLSNQALKQLPEKKKNALETDKVFEGLITLGRINEILPKWAELAGVYKHVTFHVARHTHATMMITLGADLYTVSKLLGHTNIQTTQIYAKIVDESKLRAIELIPDII